MDKKKSYYERKRVKRFLSKAKGSYILSWENANFIAAFLVFSLIFVFSANLYLPNWLAMFFIGLASFGFNFWLYKNYLNALVFALIITEVSWTMLFLALGPFTISAVLLILSYTLWRLRSKKQRILLDIIFASTAIILLLLTNKWS